MHRVQVVSVSMHYFLPKLSGCHGNIPWRIEKKVQLVHLHPKCFHTVKRLRKSGQYVLRYSAGYATMFTNEPCQLWSYWSKFTKFLLNVEAWLALLMCTVTLNGCHGNIPWRIEKKGPARSSIPFQNALRQMKGVSNFATKLVAMAISLRIPGKRRLDWSSAIQYLRQVVKMGPTDPEIIRLRAKKSTAIFDNLFRKLVTITTSLQRWQNDC